MREWLKKQYNLYKKPLWVLLADSLLSRKIGVQTQPGCLWIMPIYLSGKHNRFK